MDRFVYNNSHQIIPPTGAQLLPEHGIYLYLPLCIYII